MSESKTSGYQFGTFQGVFTPSILTILGVIMFLRFGWVLGNVGLGLTLLIVTLATSITLLTGLSLSATATNMKVGKGGAYYIISRSLGLEIGAAIGLPLFLAQALGIAFYISGFSESVLASVDITPWLEWIPFELSPARALSILTLLALTLLALISADLALKAQFFILATIAASLLSFFIGPGAPEASAPTAVFEKMSFWAVFAVFFPAVTGIEAGIAMSGDLKEPSKSLPRGTLAAVLTGYVVYMAIPVFLVLRGASPAVLMERPLILADMARWPLLILAGVWAATLSSALGALLGAPRTLQALAQDGILPRSLGRGFGKKQDPRLATACSFAVALLAVILGDLNLIAPVLSMFFLTSYGLINLSAGLEGLIESPNWRPRFKFPCWGSLLGAAACFGTMLMINSGATMIALGITAALYFLVKRRELNAHWGDMRYGLLMLTHRFALEGLMNHPPDARSWRPNVLAFSGSPQSRWNLVELAAALARGGSMLTLASVLSTDKWNGKRVASLRKSILDFLAKRDLQAMVKIFPADDMISGAEALVKGYGFGPVQPNTIVIGESRNEERFADFAGLVQLVHRMERNLVIVREKEEQSPGERASPGRIDLWWRGQTQNIGLMLTLAIQLKRSGSNPLSRIVLKRMVDTEEEVAERQEILERYVKEQRLDLDVEVMARNKRSPFDVMRGESGDADLVLLGLRPCAEDEEKTRYAAYLDSVFKESDPLLCAFVLSADDVDFSEILAE